MRNLKTFDTSNVILSKKYKLIDPKMFETVQPQSPIDKSKRQQTRQACPVCGLMFRSNYIDKHIETHDETSDKYMCDICGKKFKVKNNVSSLNLKYKSIDGHLLIYFLGLFSYDKCACFEQKTHLFLLRKNESSMVCFN